MIVDTQRISRRRHEYDLSMKEEDIPTQMTLNWKPRFKSLRSIWDVMLSKPTWLLGKMEAILKRVARLVCR